MCITNRYHCRVSLRPALFDCNGINLSLVIKENYICLSIVIAQNTVRKQLEVAML